jgi:hypothetical protein
MIVWVEQVPSEGLISQGDGWSCKVKGNNKKAHNAFMSRVCNLATTLRMCSGETLTHFLSYTLAFLACNKSLKRGGRNIIKIYNVLATILS